MMNEYDRTLIETTRSHRERLTSAFVHGRLRERHKVNTNINRLLGSFILAAVIGLACLGTGFVLGLLENQKHQKAIAAYMAAMNSNPLKPGGGWEEVEETVLLHNPETGQYIDSRTGFPVDPETMLATDPQGRLIDVRLGWFFDPETGYYTDPTSGLTIDPVTLTVVEEN
ncbi:hypothetical protein [Arachnia propionica]|uniref:OCRE domain-containing protein n=1 Tax=Arachnia propionica TaxID=1750 RepID=A0A3P1WW54_9ACTN|nr:hypothetical protein [Arachnia propionica]RRD50884.1 hypothetical protein EII35_02210 [Arachnia propionica]